MPSVSPSHLTTAIIVAFVALALFFSTTILGTLLSTSVSEQALTATRTRVVTGFFRVQLVPPVHRAARAYPTAPHDEQHGHRQRRQQPVDRSPIASHGVRALGGGPGGRSRCGGRGHRRRPRALADSQATEQAQQAGEPRALEDHESHGHAGDRVHPSEPGLPIVRRGDPGLGHAPQVDPGHRSHVPQEPASRSTSRPSCTSPSRSDSSSSRSSSLTSAGHAKFAELGAILLLVLRSVSYGSGVQGSIQGLRASQGMLEDITLRPPSLRRCPSQLPESVCPSPSAWTSTPWSTPTTG